MKSRFSISIGICAYNEADNITNLLTCITKQVENDVRIKEILVVSDGSTDKTNKLVKQFPDKRVKLIAYAKRAGKPVRMEYLLRHFSGKTLVFLDADSLLLSPTALEALVRPIRRNKKVGLVGGRCLPLQPETFVEGAVGSYIHARVAVEHVFDFEQTPYCIHGMMLALSRSFANKISIPKEILSDDAYMYFSARLYGYDVVYAKQAQGYFRSPQTLEEELKQSMRHHAGRPQLSKYFPDISIEQAYELPLEILLRIAFYQFITNPVGYIVVKVLNLYAQMSVLKGKRPIIRWEPIPMRSSKTRFSRTIRGSTA